MIFGSCPYDDCGGLLAEVLPERTPALASHLCETCGQVIWTHFSRLDPWSMTEADFLEEYEVDEATKTITPRRPGDSTA